MDNLYISRYEHDEFVKRMESENERQDKRLGILDKKVEDLISITSSIKLLANNMENMIKELKSQGERLDVIENRDGEKWREVVSHCITCVIGTVIGLFFSALMKGV